MAQQKEHDAHSSGFRRRPTPMSYRYRLFLALSFGLLSLLTSFALAADFTTARIAVYFSPSGGATDAVVREVNTASQQILVQAYSFTSVPIAKALVDAHKRGIKVLAVLDKSNETEKYSAATFLINVGIQAHAAHSHPSGRPASGSSAEMSVTMTTKHGEIHGNKHSKIYHLPGCPGY